MNLIPRQNSRGVADQQSGPFSVEDGWEFNRAARDLAPELVGAVEIPLNMVKLNAVVDLGREVVPRTEAAQRCGYQRATSAFRREAEVAQAAVIAR